jgi:hypothetical protein
MPDPPLEPQAQPSPAGATGTALGRRLARGRKLADEVIRDAEPISRKETADKAE